MDPDLPLEAPFPAALDAVQDRPALLSALRERFLAFATSRHGRDVAEDAVQEVFVVLEEKYGHLSRVEDLLPLGFQILRFRLAGWQRRSWRRGEGEQVAVEDLPLAGDDPDPETQAIRAQRLARLLEGIQALGPRCRQLFSLKLNGKDFKEIQALMGAETINTVYTWDHRCRKQLMDALGGRW